MFTTSCGLNSSALRPSKFIWAAVERIANILNSMNKTVITITHEIDKSSKEVKRQADLAGSVAEDIDKLDFMAKELSDCAQNLVSLN